MEKKAVDRKRGGKTVLKSGQGCFLPAQLLCLQATPAIIFFMVFSETECKMQNKTHLVYLLSTSHNNFYS